MTVPAHVVVGHHPWSAPVAAKKSHTRSIVIWVVWILFGVGWELFTVFEEKKTGDIPLTRLVRDDLMANSIAVVAYVVRFAVIGLFSYLSIHWLLHSNVKW